MSKLYVFKKFAYVILIYVYSIWCTFPYVCVPICYLKYMGTI